MKFQREAGFTLTELTISLVVIALVLGSTFSLFHSMMGQVERRETATKVNLMRESIIGYAMTTGRLPVYKAGGGTDELTGILANPVDYWGRRLVYLYDPEVARADIEKAICARKSTNVVVVRCPDIACASPQTQNNVAFVAFSTGKNGRNQTGASNTPHTEAAPDPSYSGPDGNFGFANLKTITVYGPGIQIGDYNNLSNNPSENDDYVVVVTLEELRQKLQCQGVPLRIVNVDFPVGATMTPYNTSIVAEGGVPLAPLGKYRWCVESTGLAPFSLAAVTNTPLPSQVALNPVSIGGCAVMAENAWTQGDLISLKGTGAGGVVTSAAQTYDLTVYVRDNQDADAAKDATVNLGDNVNSRRFIIGINGS